ncbi:hypothetical protein M1N58_00430 [Dehalococcoidales bacterium]|nr:hypothetical protein [Dehalococcoidales bacterium]MCL0094354.1 hypothetical protein [Dehalococcoidales bacterium]
MTRFLNEDRWERIRRLKKLMPDTHYKCCSGAKSGSYRNYADDVVSPFVH